MDPGISVRQWRQDITSKEMTGSIKDLEFIEIPMSRSDLSPTISFGH